MRFKNLNVIKMSTLNKIAIHQMFEIKIAKASVIRETLHAQEI